MTTSVPQVIFDEDDLIFVDKPPGFSVHNEEPSILSWAKEVLKLPQAHFPLRLDRETSGLLPILKIAKDVEKFHRTISEKHYLAILRGVVKEEAGIWGWPISDKAEGRNNPQGKSADRIKSETKFQVVKRSKFFTLVACQLGTGRNHQIRKHAAITGHAIIGDARYGDKIYNEKIAELYDSQRMFLHCIRLDFSWKNKAHSVKCQEPDAFAQIMSDLSLLPNKDSN